MTTLAEQIKALREKRGMSVEELAEISKLPIGVIECVEVGLWCELNNFYEFHAIAKALGATLEIKLVENE